ncbi:MAG: hypothetical protein LBR69_07530 [Endomicrobium sp.]|jgi:hypothetical protein|nr:hypothetical protein [Endomicrobium sp.]
MERIIKEIEDHFNKKEKYFEIFSKQHTRIEDWFRGELLELFEEKKLADEFQCEYSKCFKKDKDKWKSVDIFFKQKEKNTW